MLPLAGIIRMGIGSRIFVMRRKPLFTNIHPLFWNFSKIKNISGIEIFIISTVTGSKLHGRNRFLYFAYNSKKTSFLLVGIIRATKKSSHCIMGMNIHNKKIFLFEFLISNSLNRSSRYGLIWSIYDIRTIFCIPIDMNHSL